MSRSLWFNSKKTGFMKMCSWLERGQDFGGLGGFLAGCWGSLVASWGPLGTSWGPLGVVLEGYWLLLAPLGAFLKASWLSSSESKRYTSLSWGEKALKGPHRDRQGRGSTLIRNPPRCRETGVGGLKPCSRCSEARFRPFWADTPKRKHD